MKEYICELCGSSFISAWSDDDANDEFEENFGEVDDDGSMIVCESCYHKTMERLQSPATRH